MLREERKECVSSGATRRLEAVAGWKVDRVYRRSINTVYMYTYIYVFLSLPPQRYRTESAAAVGLKAI
jgi:hypothetical protein